MSGSIRTGAPSVAVMKCIMSESATVRPTHNQAMTDNSLSDTKDDTSQKDCISGEGAQEAEHTKLYTRIAQQTVECARLKDLLAVAAKKAPISALK